MPQTIALIAHDGKKADMVAFAKDNALLLSKYPIIATGTTGGMLQEKVDLKVERMASGPIGGDAQIASRVVEGQVKAVFFFIDPLGKHPHDPDINMLMRICNVHNVPLATNEASALCIIMAMEIANSQEDHLGEMAHLKRQLQHKLSLESKD